MAEFADEIRRSLELARQDADTFKRNAEYRENRGLDSEMVRRDQRFAEGRADALLHVLHIVSRDLVRITWNPKTGTHEILEGRTMNGTDHAPGCECGYHKAKRERGGSFDN